MSKNDLDPTKPFFLTLNVTNTDHSIDISYEESQAALTLYDAVKDITPEIDKHGGTAYIYKCIPVSRVRRQSVVVDDLTQDNSND